MTKIRRDNLSIDEIDKKQKDLDEKIRQLKEQPPPDKDNEKEQ